MVSISKKDKLFRITKALQRIGDGARECFFYSDHVIVLILILLIRLGFIKMLVTALENCIWQIMNGTGGRIFASVFSDYTRENMESQRRRSLAAFSGKIFQKTAKIENNVRFPRQFHLHLNGGYGMITTCIMT